MVEALFQGVLLVVLLLSCVNTLPLTSNEVELRKIAISQAKPELLRTAVKYARCIFVILQGVILGVCILGLIF